MFRAASSRPCVRGTKGGQGSKVEASSAEVFDVILLHPELNPVIFPYMLFTLNAISSWGSPVSEGEIGPFCYWGTGRDRIQPGWRFPCDMSTCPGQAGQQAICPATCPCSFFWLTPVNVVNGEHRAEPMSRWARSKGQRQSQ